MIAAIAAAVGAGLLWLVNRAQRRRRRAWIAWQQGRFGLRLENPGAEARRIGTRVGDVIETCEAVLDDGNRRRVVIPAGVKLRVLALEGAVEQDGATAIPKDVHFWVLDAQGERDGDGRRLAAGEYEITTGAPPMPPDVERDAPWLRWPYAFFAIGAAVGGVWELVGVALALEAPAWWRLVTLWSEWRSDPRPPAGERAALGEDAAFETKWLQFSGPLWLQRTYSADEWVLAEKSKAPAALVYDFGDPHSIEGIDVRDDAIAGAAFVLGDAIHLGTDMRVEVGVLGVVGRSRVLRTQTTTRWETVESSVRDEGGRRLVVFGDALPDIARDGFAIRMRASEGEGVEEAALSGPYPRLAETLAEWMVKEGWCRRVTPRPGLGLPRADIMDLWLRVHDVVVLAAMRAKSNSFLPPADAEWWAKGIDLAEELARAAGESAPARMLWAVTAMYAAEAGKLDDGRREKVLAMTRGATDLVRMLAPAIFARLGRAEEARERIAELRKAETGPYREARTAFGDWLVRVENELE